MADNRLVQAINEAFSRYVNGPEDRGGVSVGEYVFNEVFVVADIEDAGQIKDGKACDRNGNPLYRVKCPDGSIWRCDTQAHPMHPDLREAFRRYNVGPDWTRAEVLRMVQRLTKGQR